MRLIELVSTCLLLSVWSSTVFSIDSSYITPTYVRIISSLYEQYNDINPSWSSNGEYISFERYDMQSHKIILSNQSGKTLQTIKAEGKPKDVFDFLLSSEEDVISYNMGISWSPEHNEFVFVSSGKSNNFDLYSGNTNSNKSRRLTFHADKDNQAQWSPVNNNILFVSAREGHAGLFMIDATSGVITQVLDNTFDTLHPVWSPDGTRIALMIGVKGLYQIYVINDLKKPMASLQLVSQYSNHNIRPSWSPDGTKLAYFSFDISNSWNISIANIPANKPVMSEDTIAHDVIQNSSRGPTWLPDSINIAYIKNETDSYNPIYIVDTNQKKHSLFLTNTKMNLDLSCSQSGILAFQTQVKQWSRIYIAAIPGFNG